MVPEVKTQVLGKALAFLTLTHSCGEMELTICLMFFQHQLCSLLI